MLYHTAANKNISNRELRTFGLILGTGVVLFFGIIFPLLRDRSIDPTSWPWYLALGLALTGLTLPVALRPVHSIWMRIGKVLGFINTRIILGILYFLLFSPVALILKLMNKDPMRRTFEPTTTSYRIRSHQPKLENLNRPY